MENVYTEKTLKALGKAQLFEIAAANGIEVNDAMSNKDIMTLIIDKNCPIPYETNEAELINLNEMKQHGSGGARFTKEQLMKSNWYSHRRDIIDTLLNDDEQYSHADIEKLIRGFMERNVK